MFELLMFYNVFICFLSYQQWYSMAITYAKVIRMHEVCIIRAFYLTWRNDLEETHWDPSKELTSQDRGSQRNQIQHRTK